MTLSLSEQLAHGTVRIETFKANSPIGTGTGFFYGLDQTATGQFRPVLVTNKHVVKGADEVRFNLTHRDQDGNPIYGSFDTIRYPDVSQGWFAHPDDSVDLCVIPIASALNQGEASGTPYFFRKLDKGYLPTPEDIEEMIGLESILMIGYPNGLWDTVNNLPIFRRGTLASDYKRDWNGSREFMIDAACFPGSSGSPILLCDTGGFQTKSSYYMGQTRVKLLGILYGGPQFTATGEIQIATIQQVPIALINIPNNLGAAIRSDRLLDFEGLLP